MRKYVTEGIPCSVQACGGRAVVKGLCNRHYQAQRKHGHPLSRVRPLPGSGVCQVDDCGSVTRSPGATYCEKHYMRVRRRGSLGLRQLPDVVEHSNGYLLERAPGHPISPPLGRSRVYQHRKVFFDAHGIGPFQCHVCSSPVGWDTMHVDHLDDDPKNNALENLKPACPTCNTWRGKAKMIASSRKNGVQVTAFGRTQCHSEWAREFGLPLTTLKRRLKDGWAPEDAISSPSGPTGKKARKTIA